MSGIIAVYALVVAVLIAGNMKPPPNMEYSLFNGFMHLACGLSVGLTGLAAGYAIGTVGDAVSLWLLVDDAGTLAVLTRAMTGRTIVHAAVAGICGHGVDFDLWRGVGAVWVRHGRRVGC